MPLGCSKIADPSSVETSGSGYFVEIFNLGYEDIDLSTGCFLRRSTDQLTLVNAGHIHNKRVITLLFLSLIMSTHLISGVRCDPTSIRVSIQHSTASREPDRRHRGSFDLCRGCECHRVRMDVRPVIGSRSRPGQPCGFQWRWRCGVGLYLHARSGESREKGGKKEKARSIMMVTTTTCCSLDACHELSLASSPLAVYDHRLLRRIRHRRHRHRDQVQG